MIGVGDLYLDEILMRKMKRAKDAEAREREDEDEDSDDEEEHNASVMAGASRNVKSERVARGRRRAKDEIDSDG